MNDTLFGGYYGFHENGKKIEDPAEIVMILNNQFKSVFVVDNGERPEFSR